MSSANTSVEQDDMLIQQLNTEKTLEYAPVLAFVVIVIVCGLVGNSMTVLFYGFVVKKTIASFLLAIVSINDLIASVAFVDEIIDLIYMLTFRSHVGCSFIYFVNHILVLNSYLFLLLVGVDRFFLICFPFSKWIFTKSSAKKSVAGLVIVSVLVAVRDFAIIDIVHMDFQINDNKTIIAYRCAHSVADHIAIYIRVFHSIDVALFVIIIASLVVLYILIWKSIILRTRRYTKRPTVKRTSVNGTEMTPGTVDTDLDLSSTDAEIDNERTIEVNNHIFEEYSIESSDTKLDDRKSNTTRNELPINDKKIQTYATNASTTAKSAKKKAKLDKTVTAERSITVTVFAMTAASIISLLPYFIVTLTLGANSHQFSAAQQVAHRSFIINHAVNPYVIGMVNSEFRQFLWTRFCRCCIKRRRRS